MVKHKKLSMAVAGAFALCGASAAHAFNVKAGDWDLSMSGEVNAFYTYTHCDNNANPVKQIVNPACVTSNENSFSSIESGLLPSALVFSAKTTQEGFDIGVTFGFYPGINNGGQVGGANSPGANIGLGSTGIDMRQNFLTFGDKEMGTIKMGRDLGLFGSDAILSDMTLLGVGTNQSPSAPGNTTLGRIGVGYIYADWIPQITYITPSFDGFQVSGGIFQPLDTLGLDSGTSATANSLPMFQAKATYDFNVNDDIKGGRVWVSGLAQRSIANAAIDTGAPAATNVGVTQFAGDVGIKANVYGFEPVIYYYQARGVGTTGIGLFGIDATGAARNSRGGYFQVGRSFGKWRPSFSYGLSQLHTGSGESNATNPALVHTNRSRVQMLQYQLTKSLTLVEEFTTTHSRAQLNIPGTSGTNMQYNISLGAILFF
jgi:predicted porin